MRIYAAGIAAFMLMLLLVSGAAAQGTMRVYIEEGAMEDGQARQLMALLGEAEEAWQWTLVEDGRTLRELVLAGTAPDLAICAPKAARPWAQEGMLIPLQAHIGSQTRMQRQVLELCVQDEVLFAAPLIARHRQMAVNRRMLEERGVGYMLDSQTYPVWYPAQFYQILEEFLLLSETAVDVWRAQPPTSAPIEALTQAIFGGTLLSEDGSRCEADSMDMCAGVQWLADAVEDELVGCCETREDALDRFLDGETAIFIDWTQQEAERHAQAIREAELDIVTMPYPAGAGLPMRSFELTGVCAFESGDSVRDAALKKACTLLHERAQDVLGQRGIWQDGAFWPSSLDRDDYTATLRSLFCTALEDVIGGVERAETALGRVQAAMDAMGAVK